MRATTHHFAKNCPASASLPTRFIHHASPATNPLHGNHLLAPPPNCSPPSQDAARYGEQFTCLPGHQPSKNMLSFNNLHSFTPHQPPRLIHHQPRPYGEIKDQRPTITP